MAKKSVKSFVHNLMKEPARIVETPVPLSLAEHKLASLYQSLAKATPDDQISGIIQFLSAYRGEGAGHISFELANFVASNTNKRVLFLDASFVPPPSMDYVSAECNVPISHYLKHGSTGNDVPFVQLAGNDLYFGRFFDVAGENTYIDPDELVILFDELRAQYDIVLLYTEAMLENESASVFSGVSDGSVLVVEAERTRRQVIKRLIAVIQENGGTVLGSILNKRRFYTPSWIHKIFFPSDRGDDS